MHKSMQKSTNEVRDGLNNTADHCTSSELQLWLLVRQP